MLHFRNNLEKNEKQERKREEKHYPLPANFIEDYNLLDQCLPPPPLSLSFGEDFCTDEEGRQSKKGKEKKKENMESAEHQKGKKNINKNKWKKEEKERILNEYSTWTWGTAKHKEQHWGWTFDIDVEIVRFAKFVVM